MVSAASVVAALGTVVGTVSALDDGAANDEARPGITRSPSLLPLPAVPTPTRPPSSRPGRSVTSPRAKATATPTSRPSPSRKATVPVSARLYRHRDAQVDDWMRAHPGDARRPVIASRIASQPVAVWFADYAPDAITSRVRDVTSPAAARGQVPVVVPYAIPGRDCGGASAGGAPDLDAYDAWIDRFAAGLGSGEVIVILEPDSLAQAGCLPEADRRARYASLARAGRVVKEADPRARVYYDAGHSGWNPAATQAARLRSAGAASAASSDGIFTNVSNFQRTADETAYARQVLAALDGPPGLGAVIDTSRNGNGAPADGQWCDPAGRSLGEAPTLRTGQARIDGFLWVKPPGESDGCKGEPGTFSAAYAYELATG
jgi:endoglucanase